MMGKWVACVAVLALSGAALAAQAPRSGYQKVSISKAALGSTPIRLWANTAIEPDCTTKAGSGATLAVVEQPTHGTATISDEPFFFGFPVNNPRAACNTRKIPGHQAFYTASPGYAGHDRLVLQGSSPEGLVRRITVNIDVK